MRIIKNNRTGKIITQEELLEKAKIKKLIEEAKAGDATSQKLLGDCYYNGDGVVQNYKKAVYWYNRSATQGNAEAQFWLGYCFCFGEGVAENINKAQYWLEFAAAAGIEEAKLVLWEEFGYDFDQLGFSSDGDEIVWFNEKTHLFEQECFQLELNNEVVLAPCKKWRREDC